jgi:uncharacterized protein
MFGKKNPLTSLIIFIVFILFFSLSSVVYMVTDYYWFGALGFESIFLIGLKAKIMLFTLSALAFFGFLMVNLWISSIKGKAKIVSFKLKFLLALVISVVVGTSTSQKWFILLKYLEQVPFGLSDPIFIKDVAFYVFSLPFLLLLWKFAMSCVVVTIILVALDYLQSKLSSLFKPPKVVNPEAKPQFKFDGLISSFKNNGMGHLGVLVALFFVLLSVRHYLSKFTIMYSEMGIVVGAGYTDVAVILPAFKILMVVALIVAAVMYLWFTFFSSQAKLRKRHIVSYAIAVYVVFYVVGMMIVPGVVQSMKVSPNEINLEKPYIEKNIEFTKIAYGLDNVEEQEFDVEAELSAKVLDNASETIDNVRILDWRPLTKTYKQTQEIRLYYDLEGIDIDRYYIDGKYTQVMVAPRELDQRQIAANAQTWVNLHMVYTHGFGAVMSPVNSVTKEGLPNYYIQDIPPVQNVGGEDLRIDQPRVYYGERDNDYVLVNSKTEEFDYPKGNTNEYISYDGKGGVKLDTFWKKVLMAIRFRDLKILLSSDMTPESRIMFSRNIQERISKITPFLLLDMDPYLVISDGRMKWIQDAYTVTSYFPYSQKYMGSINYLRNSVKVVMDAYDGDVTYYIMDVNDPLIETYSKIYPNQFKPFAEMPSNLKSHTRYPEDLFKVQSSIYNTYHMNDATVFYNKEDAWQVPSEIYGTSQQVDVEPYYVIMKLPGEEKEEFVLMSPFTPIKKDNMVAWLAARSDGDHYGKLLLYKFQKDKLIYGPMQIEAKFDQDSDISQQITLWSQQGSKVTRGNLLVIPIENSILYVEPLYIQSEKGELPQLKRILASDGERVVMEESLIEALEELFGKSQKKTVQVSDNNETGTVVSDDLIERANKYYEDVLSSMEEQDWVAIGDNFEKLGDTLQALTFE